MHNVTWLNLQGTSSRVKNYLIKFCVKDYLLPCSEMLSNTIRISILEVFENWVSRIEFLGTVTLLLSITDNMLFDLLIYLFQIALEIMGWPIKISNLLQKCTGQWKKLPSLTWFSSGEHLLIMDDSQNVLINHSKACSLRRLEFTCVAVIINANTFFSFSSGILDGEGIFPASTELFSFTMAIKSFLVVAKSIIARVHCVKGVEPLVSKSKR